MPTEASMQANADESLIQRIAPFGGSCEGEVLGRGDVRRRFLGGAEAVGGAQGVIEGGGSMDTGQFQENAKRPPIRVRPKDDSADCQVARLSDRLHCTLQNITSKNKGTILRLCIISSPRQCPKASRLVVRRVLMPPPPNLTCAPRTLSARSQKRWQSQTVEQADVNHQNLTQSDRLL